MTIEQRNTRAARYSYRVRRRRERRAERALSLLRLGVTAAGFAAVVAAWYWVFM